MVKSYDWADLDELYTKQNLSSLVIGKLKHVSGTAVIRQLRRKNIHVRNRTEQVHVVAPSPSLNCDWSDLKELYIDKKLSTSEIGKQKGCSSALVSHEMKRQQIPARSWAEGNQLARDAGKIHYNYGEDNPNWKGGVRKNGDGYIRFKNPTHPRASDDGYVLEHILIWERVHNKPVPEGWEVHHLNGIKNDNRPCNLAGMPDKKHRRVLAAKAQRIRELEEENRLLRKALDDGQMIFNLSEN